MNVPRKPKCSPNFNLSSPFDEEKDIRLVKKSRLKSIIVWYSHALFPLCRVHVEFVVMSPLGSNQRLCLRNDRFLGHLAFGLGDLSNLRLLGGSSRELGLLRRSNRGGLLGSCGDRRSSTAATEHLLDLASVVTSVLLAHGSQLIGLLLGNASDLSSLGVNSIGGRLEVLVDQLLVGGVNQRNEEANRGGNDGEAPVGNKLDEVVGHEGGNAGLKSILLVLVPGKEL